MSDLDAGKCKDVRIAPTVLGFVSAILISFALLIFAAYVVCYLWPGYMQSEFEKYNVLANLPAMTMSHEDGLMAVCDHMMDYLLHGKQAEDLQIEAMIGGVMRPFFNERELLHMKDVRDIFAMCIRCSIFGTILAVALQALSRFKACHNEPKTYRLSTGIGMLIGILTAAVVCVVLVMAGGDGFGELFVNFHEVMFDNDLWLLDPRDSLLINILPEAFFFDTAVRIGGVFALLMIIYAVVSAAMIASARRK